MTPTLTIRPAETEDAAALLAIYAPYVLHTAITFEYDVPTVAEFAERIRTIKQRFPYLVATAGPDIVGYAYAGTFKNRAAYQWAVETSIYVDCARQRHGAGRLLHEALEEALRRQGILNLNACIAYSESAEPYLPEGSVGFHQRMGYRQVAHFHQCGYKFDRWYDMIWMEKLIGPHTTKGA